MTGIVKDRAASVAPRAVDDAFSESIELAIADGDALLGREIDSLAAQLGDLASRLDLIEATNSRLRRDNIQLRDEIADLAHQVELQKAARGDADGQSLPASLVRKAHTRKTKPKLSAELTQ